MEDFYALEDQMVEAQEAYVAALEALENVKTSKRGNVEATPDQRPAILKKMDKLAEAVTGKPAGLDAAVGAFMWSWNLDLDLEHLALRFERLVDHYANDPVLDDVLLAVGVAGTDLGKPDDWIATLNRLITRTTRNRTRLGALVILGQVELGAGKLSEAKASFTKVIKAGAQSDFADEAKGYMFEIDHLQVGMVAPDFVAETLSGEMLSLRSLRGKVVLLNFWATW